MAMYIFQLYII